MKFRLSERERRKFDALCRGLAGRFSRRPKSERCPFCEYKDVYVVNTMANDFHVFCPNCLAQGPVEASEARAAGAWNAVKR